MAKLKVSTPEPFLVRVVSVPAIAAVVNVVLPAPVTVTAWPAPITPPVTFTVPLAGVVKVTSFCNVMAAENVELSAVLPPIYAMPALPDCTVINLATVKAPLVRR